MILFDISYIFNNLYSGKNLSLNYLDEMLSEGFIRKLY